MAKLERRQKLILPAAKKEDHVRTEVKVDQKLQLRF